MVWVLLLTLMRHSDFLFEEKAVILQKIDVNAQSKNIRQVRVARVFAFVYDDVLHMPVYCVDAIPLAIY